MTATSLEERRQMVQGNLSRGHPSEQPRTIRPKQRATAAGGQALLASIIKVNSRLPTLQRFSSVSEAAEAPSTSVGVPPKA
jgi:hypothetical protein